MPMYRNDVTFIMAPKTVLSLRHGDGRPIQFYLPRFTGRTEAKTLIEVRHGCMRTTAHTGG
jgi:hypothetical protein